MNLAPSWIWRELYSVAPAWVTDPNAGSAAKAGAAAVAPVAALQPEAVVLVQMMYCRVEIDVGFT